MGLKAKRGNTSRQERDARSTDLKPIAGSALLSLFSYPAILSHPPPTSGQVHIWLAASVVAAAALLIAFFVWFMAQVQLLRQLPTSVHSFVQPRPDTNISSSLPQPLF
jgi:hypothetical protein